MCPQREQGPYEEFTSCVGMNMGWLLESGPGEAGRTGLSKIEMAGPLAPKFRKLNRLT